MATYTAIATFSLQKRTDRHLRNVRAIDGELQSWLESLNATVLGVHAVCHGGQTALCDKLQSIALQAVQALGISASSDNLCDLLDDIDNDVQGVIAVVNRARSGGAGGDA